MVLWFVMMNFMDRDSGVHNARLDGFLLNDGLDRLMYVMVDMFSCESGLLRVALFDGACGTGVFKLSSLLLDASLDLIMVAVLVLAVFDLSHAVMVLLG